MARRLLNALTALSLLLCAAVAVLWVWSHRAAAAAGPGGLGRPRNHLCFYHRAGSTACFAPVADGRLWLTRQHVWRGEGTPDSFSADVGVPGKVTAFDSDQAGRSAHASWNGWGGPGGFDVTQFTTRAPCVVRGGGPGPRLTFQAVRMPLWVPAVGLLVLPAAAGGRWRAAARHRARGLCLECGYDLCASPGRCLECGQDNPAGISN